MNERRVIFFICFSPPWLPQAAALPPCKKYTPIIPHLYSKRHGNHSPILRTLFVQKDNIFRLVSNFALFLTKNHRICMVYYSKTVSQHFARRRRKKTGPPPPKKGGPVFQYAENGRNSYKSYKPDAAGLFGHAHDARPAGGKRAGTKENPELFQMEKLGISGGRGWIRTTEALSSRFTVCPHWPLGNTPSFCLADQLCLAGRLVYFTTGFAVCQQLFEIFQARPMRCPVLSGCLCPCGAAGCAGLLAYSSTRREILSTANFAFAARLVSTDKIFESSCLFSGGTL